MVNRIILHYKIIEVFGRGGMGIVFKATDTKIKSDVAIKLLAQNISVDKNEKKCFEIEAQAAASLSYLNVTTIFAIEEFDNLLFLVMEFIDRIELMLTYNIIIITKHPVLSVK